MTNIAIEHCHRNSEISHENMLIFYSYVDVYQRVMGHCQATFDEIHILPGLYLVAWSKMSLWLLPVVLIYCQVIKRRR